MEDSIISIPDSDNSQVNETFSPPAKTEATVNTTFTPEEKKMPDEKPVNFNETFSPLKPETPTPNIKVERPTISEVQPPPEIVEKQDNVVEDTVASTIKSAMKKSNDSNKKQLKFSTESKVATPTVRRSFRKTPKKQPEPIVTPAKPISAKKFQLKSIRKRSFSVTDIDEVPKRVQFNSPANMEKTITEIDESMHLNFSKNLQSVPKRRQRSMSNAETQNDKIAFAISLQEQKTKLSSPSPRGKMPNFAAIHQSIFNNMENLLDFKERTKERAQFLLNSDKKPARPNILKPVNRGGAISKIPKQTMKSKLGGQGIVKAKNRAIGKKSNTSTNFSENKLLAIIKQTSEDLEDMPKAAGFSATSVVSENVVPQPKEERSYTLRNRNVAQSSFKIEPVETTTKPIAEIKPQMAQVAPKITKPPTTTAPDTKTKSIRGVRINRHFDLLMKFRNNKK